LQKYYGNSQKSGRVKNSVYLHLKAFLSKRSEIEALSRIMLIQRLMKRKRW
jgi:hypothetical protein